MFVVGDAAAKANDLPVRSNTILQKVGGMRSIPDAIICKDDLQKIKFCEKNPGLVLEGIKGIDVGVTVGAV